MYITKHFYRTMIVRNIAKIAVAFFLHVAVAFFFGVTVYAVYDST